MPDRFEHKLLRFVRLRLLETFTTMYVVILAWGSLVPFDFDLREATVGAAKNWIGLPITRPHLPDVVSNIALYLALGLLLRATLRHRGWGGFNSMFATLALAGGFSYANEWLQGYSPTRISCLSDFLSNLAGATLGAGLFSSAVVFSAMYRKVDQRVTRIWRERFLRRPGPVVAQLWALILLLGWLAPFDVTFSPNQVYESVKDTCLTPFAKDARLSEAIHPGPTSESVHARQRMLRDRWQLRLDYAGTVAGFAILSILTIRYLSTYCGIRGFNAALTSVGASTVLAVVASFGRFFIISRSADITDVLLAAVGATLGAMTAGPVLQAWAPDADRNDAPVMRARHRMVTWLLAGWCLQIAGHQLAPFYPVASAASIAHQVNSAEWLPMRDYQRTRLPVAIDDLVTKIWRYGGLAILLCAWRARGGRSDVRQNVVRTAWAVGSVTAVLECAQLLLPTRVPSLTDVLIATIASGCGVVAYRIGWAYLFDERTIRSAAEGRVIFNVEFDASGAPPQERAPQRAEVQQFHRDEGDATP